MTQDQIAQRFEQDRDRLRAVALRMLGSSAEADDAVQETWIRLSRTDTSSVDNLSGWLTTVCSRVCLDLLRSRTSRREDPVDQYVDQPAEGPGPEQEAILADTVGLAMLVVLDTLAPSERLAFVLHDLFAVPFEDIAQILGRSALAVRQLASRGRRRVQGADAADPDGVRQREVVQAFLAASRAGDFDALLALLHPDAALRADAANVRMGGQPLTVGAHAVATTLCGRAHAARLATLDNVAGAAWSTQGVTKAAFSFTVIDGLVVEIELLSEPETLAQMQISID